MQKDIALQLGGLVVSKQGRDAGNFYIIVKVESPDFVFCSNGENRTYQKPKRKRVKHLIITHQVAAELNTKLAKGSKVDVSEIVFAIKKFKEKYLNEKNK